MTAAALVEGKVVYMAEEARGRGPAAAELAFCPPGFQSPRRVSALVSMTSAALDKGKAIVEEEEAREGAAAAAGFIMVMKLDSSSVRSAERKKQVAEIILSVPEGIRIVVVLSAMEQTTNYLVVAGEKACLCDEAEMVSRIDELNVIKEFHIRTVQDLGLDSSILTGTLNEMENFLKSIAIIKELTPRTRDCLVSFGERLSTEMFSAYLQKLGRKAQQYDVLDARLVDTAKYNNILQATYSTIIKRLEGDWNHNSDIHVVPRSLWKERKSCAFTTFGRGVSDLTAATIGRASGPREIQVMHPLAMRPACEGDIPVLQSIGVTRQMILPGLFDSERKAEPTTDGHIGLTEEAKKRIEHMLPSHDDPMRAIVDNGEDPDWERDRLLQQPEQQVLAEAAYGGSRLRTEEEEEVDTLLAYMHRDECASGLQSW